MTSLLSMCLDQITCQQSRQYVED